MPLETGQSDSYREIALDAINTLYGEEIITEQEFGGGTADFHEDSKELRARLAAMDADTPPVALPSSRGES